MPIAEGDVLPELTLTLPDGTPLPLRSDGGGPIVLFFYPRAGTPGCTREAQDFDALSGGFADAGVTVIGVSRDWPAALQRFAAKQALTITLASDAGAVSDAFGFWGEKTLYGRRFMGMERATALIDGRGRIARVWRRVRVAGHAQQVLQAARELVDSSR